MAGGTVISLEKTKLKEEIWHLETKRKLLQGQAEAQGDFFLVGPVMESSVHSLMDDMDTWSRLHPGLPMTLTINSQGGVVIDGFALYDFLQALKRKGHHLTTIGLGLQASMGGVLLQAGDERVMT